MIELSEMLRKTLVAGVAVSFFVLACSGSSGGGSSGTSGSSGSSGDASSGGDGSVTPADNCSSFAGAYDVTSEIVTTDCPLGLHTISVTWTFVQTAPSCSFTMTNTLYKGPTYSGYFTMQGTQAKVTWTTVDPAPISGGHALTYVSENLVIAAPGTVSGSFDWKSAYGCTGTTNICHGSIPAGCLTPN